MLQLSRLASFVALLILAQLAKAQSSEAAERLSALLKNVSSLQAEFDQATSREQHQQRYSGKLWISKPDRFRIASSTPSPQLLVSDGKSFWNFDEALEQVIISKSDNSSTQVPITLFTQAQLALNELYNVNSYEDERREVFLLEPLDDISLVRVLTIEFENGEPAEIRVEADSGQSTVFMLTHVKMNPELDASLFSFTAPAGVDVIDER